MTGPWLAKLREDKRLEGIYTGKAMAGLIDHVRQGRLRPDDTVVFVHTGGLPNLFMGAFQGELASPMES